jgi:hypothetical protein
MINDHGPDLLQEGRQALSGAIVLEDLDGRSEEAPTDHL